MLPARDGVESDVLIACGGGAPGVAATQPPGTATAGAAAATAVAPAAVVPVEETPGRQ